VSLTEDAPGDGDTDFDGSDDGTAGAGSNTTDGGGGDTDSGGSLSSGDVADIVRALLPDWVLTPPPALRAFIDRPIATVTTIVVGWIFQDIVLPIVRGVLEAALAVVGAILVLAQSIATLGDLLISSLVGGFAPVGAAVLNTLAQVNGTIAQAAASAGLAAPLVVTLLYGIEIGVAGYLAVSLLESIDVPLVDLGGILRAVTAPIKFVVGLVR
jgi:hypothetical protein